MITPNVRKVDVLVTQMEPGGAQKAAISLANLLATMDIAARLIFFYKKLEPAHGIGPGVEVVICTRRGSTTAKALAPTALYRLLRDDRPDAIIAFTHYANTIGALIARTLGIPIVVSHRNPASSYPALAALLDRFLYKVGCYDVVTYVSEATKNSFQQRYGHCEDPYRHLIIYNGWQQQADGAPVPGAALLMKPYVIAVGRLVSQKNHELLLRAMALSSYRGDLVIVGTGPLQDTLTDLAVRLQLQHRVHLVGNLPNATVQELVRAAQAFLMPSRFEGLSNALLEALCLGTPVIVSDIPPQVEAITMDGRHHGRIAQLQSIEDWVHAISAVEGMARSPEPVKEGFRRKYSSAGFAQAFLAAAEAAVQART